MSLAKTSVKVGAALAEALWLTAAIWLLRGYVWPWLSPVEVSPLQAALDPTLFQHDFVVQESLRFTPRFYYNGLILLTVRAGLSLPWAFAAWHCVALGGIVTGLRAIARTLGFGAVASAVLVVWALNAKAGELGAVFLYTHGPVPAVWAGALAVWGIAAALRGRWTAAFACFGGAALLQFLVGFYAGLLVLPALWRERGVRGAVPPLGAWALGLALVYLPLWASEASTAGLLGNAVFVEIYAQLRHPHHLVPSTWSWAAWSQTALFYAGGVWCCRRLGAPRTSRERGLLAVALALTGLLLVANFLWVEVWPWALVAKLQPARATPFAQLALLVALAGAVQALWSRRDYAGAALVAAAPLSPYPGCLLLLGAVLLFQAPASLTWRHAVLAGATLLAYHSGLGSTAASAAQTAVWTATFLALLIPVWFARRPAWRLAAALGGGTGALACAFASQSPAWPRAMEGHFAIDARPFDAPGELGRRFGQHAPTDAIVLLPPTGDVWTFKLFARRAVVVDDKNFPFTSRGMAEWKERMDAVLGTPLTRGLDAEGSWAAQPPARVAVVANRYGARYVLTRDVWHPSLRGTVVDRLQGWTLWELAP